MRTNSSISAEFYIATLHAVWLTFQALISARQIDMRVRTSPARTPIVCIHLAPPWLVINFDEEIIQWKWRVAENN